MKVYVVNAFSMEGAGGNKAGIVCDGQLRSSEEKTQIAAIMGFSETVFSYSSAVADYKLEYFTPAGEVPLCGHATIAFFIFMLHRGMLLKDKFTIETKAGIFHIDVCDDGTVFMEQAQPEFLNEVPWESLEKCFHPLSPDHRIPPRIVSTGLKDILMPVKSIEALGKMKMDAEAVTELSRKMGCVGVHAFSLDAVDSFSESPRTAVCRNFAPLYDIDEESATGTSNCALACYLFKLGIRPDRYVFEQGYNLGSPSRIEVRIIAEGDEIRSVSVGGKGHVEEEKEIGLR